MNVDGCRISGYEFIESRSRASFWTVELLLLNTLSTASYSTSLLEIAVTYWSLTTRGQWTLPHVLIPLLPSNLFRHTHVNPLRFHRTAAVTAIFPFTRLLTTSIRHHSEYPISSVRTSLATAFALLKLDRYSLNVALDCCCAAGVCRRRPHRRCRAVPCTGVEGKGQCGISKSISTMLKSCSHCQSFARSRTTGNSWNASMDWWPIRYGVSSFASSAYRVLAACFISGCYCFCTLQCESIWFEKFKKVYSAPHI
jgi:hypothetical protein